jgi:AcrR family transcriptional regulator
MGRPRKDAFDEATVLRVLRAAEKTFGERGFADARLEDIAADAGIRRPSLLYHFGSKAKLYSAVVQRAFEEIRSAVGEALSLDSNYEETVVRTTRALVDLEKQHRALLGVVLRTLLDPRAESRDLVMCEFVPIIDMLVAYVEQHGRDRVGSLPVRPAISQLVISHLARAAMSDQADRIWGVDDHTEALARALLAPPRS